MRLEGKKVIVTGANGGVGQAISRLFEQEGAAVAMIDRVTASCELLAQEMKRKGRKSLVIQADLSRVGGIKELVKKVKEDFGGIDILVSNAGVVERHTLEEIRPKDWDRTFNVNLKAAFFAIQAVVKYMRAQKDGRIVCIGSRASKDGGMNVGISYAASKAGLELLVKRLSRDMGSWGIRINLIRPGAIDTPFLDDLSLEQKEDIRKAIPLGRLCSPWEVAQAALFLASEESSFISGAILDIAGGL